MPTICHYNILHLKKTKLILIVALILSAMSSPAFSRSNIKEPNVSGQFYDANPKRLSAVIEEYLSQAVVSPSERSIRFVIAPHAGYMYSGGVAAYGFKAASQNIYNTILVLAPSHHVDFDGISVWEEGGFQTPLGVAQVDESFARQLTSANSNFFFEPRAFELEHSLEVEIPFIQKVFPDAKIVPMVMGQPGFSLLKDFARTLDRLIGDRQDVLVVVSTDLSHYHDDAAARQMDAQAIDAVKNFDIERLWSECQARTMEMCGFVPVTAALLTAKAMGLSDIEVLHYANSGDVTGDTDRVVGYVSIIIYGDNPKKEELGDVGRNEKDQVDSLTTQQKQRLIEIARAAVEEYVRTGKRLDFKETDARLMEEEGAFVTIHSKSQLRGCIGNIIGRKPLYLTVRDMAIAAASEDPRFPPVAVRELDEIDVEISVLSKPRAVKDVNKIELGKHGVIVSQGPRHYGVFLPQVATETGWSKEEFMSELCSQKAHLPADAWKDSKTKIEVFTANVFSEKDFH